MRTPGNIQTARACAQCGYSLAGTPREGNCPECGTTAQQAYEWQPLEHASFGWQVRFLVGLACVAAAGVLNGIGHAAERLGWTWPPLVYRGWFVAFKASIILWVWLVTSPDPRTAMSEGSLSVRRIARVVGVAMPVILYAALQLMPAQRTDAMWALLYALFNLEATALLLVGAYCLTLTMRLYRPDIVAWAICGWSLLFVAIVVQLCGDTLVVLGLVERGDRAEWFSVSNAISTGGGLVLIWPGMVLVTAIVRAIRFQRDDSRHA